MRLSWLLLAVLLAGLGKQADSASTTPPQPPGPRALPSMPKEGRVTVLRVHGTIDLGLAPFVERVVKGLSENDILVLDINTLGGRVDAAIVIRDSLLHAKGKTVAWINPRAISAGALIALSCDVIAVASGATIGAATPVQAGEGGQMKPVEEKVVSYMRKEMRATAEAKGRKGEIAEAMVDADAEVPGLDEKGKLLTLDGGQALAWGIAEISATDEGTLLAALGRGAMEPDAIRRPSLSWAEKVARFLSDPVVSGLLMTIGMLGVLIELYSPGHGVSLGIGLLCLGLFFFGHHVVKLAGWEEMLLFVVGVGLVAFEVLVPGHVLPGVVGVLCIVTSLVLALVNMKHVPTRVAWDMGWLPDAITTVSGSIVLTFAAAWGIIKFLPSTRAGKPLVLRTALSGASAGPDHGISTDQVGEALTDLRPVGKVLVAGSRIDAVAERGYVAKGARVRVVRSEGGRVVVRHLEPEAGQGDGKEQG
ncbi:MAG: hypothetical protein HY698_02405 [Deltaproteobacteria bacterium]|nr:hypothetical protein [Deltaproteobacteria bacterium]